MNSQDDLDLLRQAQEYIHICEERGRPNEKLKTAWGNFFLIENERLWLFVSATGAPKDQRDDVVQEVWLEITKRLHGFQGDHAVAQLHAWMYKLIHSKAARIIRHLSEHPTKSMNAKIAEPEDGRRSAPEDREEAARTWRSFHVWLEKIQKKEPLNYQLIHGRLVEWRKIKELARASGLRENVVSSRIKRLKEKFRVWISQCGGGDART